MANLYSYEPERNLNKRIKIDLQNIPETQKVFFHEIKDDTNNQQSECIENILNILNYTERSVNLITGEAGTGKSYILPLIIKRFKYQASYIAFSNALINKMGKYPNTFVQTDATFFMDLFNLNFFTNKNFWFDKEKKEIDIKNKILKIKSCKYKLLIIDEVFLLPFHEILAFYMLSKHLNIHIIFIGDPFQLGPIVRTVRQKVNLFDLLKENVTKHYHLEENMRQLGDKKFHEKIMGFKKLLLNHKCPTKITFEMKFYLFEKFITKFGSKTDYKALFLSSFHRQNLQRVEQMSLNTQGVKMPFRDENNNFLMVGDRLESEKKSLSLKFPGYVWLCEGLNYFYRDKSYILKKFDNEVVTLQDDQGVIKEITPVPISRSFLHEEHLTVLRERKEKIYQFPLQHNIVTLHKLQGSTIETNVAELNIDTDSANGLYVGLSRFTSEKQINKFYTENLTDLVFTKKMNDEYFYKNVCSADFNEKFFDGKNFDILIDVNKFEKSSNKVKIKRSFYEKYSTKTNEIAFLDLFLKSLWKEY